MHARVLVAAGLGLAATLTAGAVMLNNAGGAGPAAGPQAGASATGPSRTAQAAETGSSAAGPGTAKPRPATASATAGAKAGEKAAKTGKPLEVLPPAGKAKTGLPDSRERGPVISGALPKSGSRQGGLVKGFPKDAVPVPDGARVVTSSVATQGNTLQAGLEASTKLSAKRVLAVYQADFEDKGWLYTAVPAADGAQAIRGGFEDDSVTVTVAATGTGATSVSVFAVLHAAD